MKGKPFFTGYRPTAKYFNASGEIKSFIKFEDIDWNEANKMLCEAVQRAAKEESPLAKMLKY